MRSAPFILMAPATASTSSLFWFNEMPTPSPDDYMRIPQVADRHGKPDDSGNTTRAFPQGFVGPLCGIRMVLSNLRLPPAQPSRQESWAVIPASWEVRCGARCTPCRPIPRTVCSPNRSDLYGAQKKQREFLLSILAGTFSCLICRLGFGPAVSQPIDGIESS